MMWHEDDILPWYSCGDDDYEDCQNNSERRALRVLKTYHDLVSQRYYDPYPFPYKDFKLRGNRQLRLHGKKYLRGLEYIGDHLEGRDPARFVAFIFELWSSHSYYHVFKRLGWKERSGVQFPSITKIIEHKEALVKYFLTMPDEPPKNFIPVDYHISRRKKAVEERVQRWCSAFDKGTWDYWRSHLNPYAMPYQDLDYAESFWELDEKFQKEFGLSAQEIRDALQEIDEAADKAENKLYQKISKRNNRLRAKGEDPQYDNIQVIPYEKLHDEYTCERIYYIQAALDRGVDITTEEFERDMEDTINPIDYEHPDTVMFYMYGHGDGPRRKHDGSLSE